MANHSITDFCAEFGNKTGASSRGMVALAVLLLIVGSIFAIWALFYFLANRPKYIQLRRRNFFPIFCIYILSLTLFLTGTVGTIVGFDKFPCRNYGLIYQNSSWLYLHFGITRMVSLIGRINFHKGLISESYRALVQGTLNIPAGKTAYITNGESTASFYSSTILDKQIVKEAPPNPQQLGKVRAIFWSIVFKLCCWSPPQDFPKQLQVLHFLGSQRFTNWFWLVFGVLFVTINFVTTKQKLPFDVECTGCLYENRQRFTPREVFFFGLFTCFCYTLGLYLLKSIPDSLGVKQELLIHGIVSLASYAAIYFIAINTTEAQLAGTFLPQLLESLLFVVVIFIILTLPVLLVKRAASLGLAVEITLDTILASSEGRKAFMLYLVSNLSLETLLFYEETGEWAKLFHVMPQDQRAAEAEKLYERFISADSFLPINISARVRQQLMVDRANGYPIETFDTARKSMERIMTDTMLFNFVKSDYYSAYCNDSRDN